MGYENGHREPAEPVRIRRGCAGNLGGRRGHPALGPSAPDLGADRASLIGSGNLRAVGMQPVNGPSGLRRRSRPRRIRRSGLVVTHAGLELLLLRLQSPASSQGAQLSTERPRHRPGSRPLEIDRVDRNRSDWANHQRYDIRLLVAPAAAGVRRGPAVLSPTLPKDIHRREPAASATAAGGAGARRLTLTALGARSSGQETARSHQHRGPLGIASLSSGNVHIPDGSGKSKSKSRKTPSRPAAESASATRTSNCDFRKNSAPAPQGRPRGFLDRHAPQRQVRLPTRHGCRTQSTPLQSCSGRFLPLLERSLRFR